MLGLLALVNAKLAVLASFGFCSLLGLKFGPMHSLIPILLIGLGVDNAFVIVQEYNNAEQRDKDLRVRRSLVERIANGLRHAGVGITVTSMTDVIVFAVGGTTVLPSLRSYSLYAAVGILFTFFLQTTFFVACLTIDTKRIDQLRNGMFCCIKYNPDTWIPNSFSQKNWLQLGFNKFGLVLQKNYAKMAVILAAIMLGAYGVYGSYQIRIEFDFVKFLPEDSNLAQWFSVHKQYFPLEGYRGTMYFTGNDFKS